MNRAIGVDPGTMFFQTAETIKDQISLKTIRNAFVELPETDDIQDILNNNSWKWVKDNNRYYVIGEDALRVVKMFPNLELRRPMQDGVLNKNEEKKMIIMQELVESLAGKSPDEKSVACFCISSPSVDNSQDSAFHKARLAGMFKRLGWQTKVLEEGMAVVLSERPVAVDSEGVEQPYSGIGLSFGAGKANCVLAYKGLPVIGLSAAMSGDYIDKKVSEVTDTPISHVISIKEKQLNFEDLDYNNDVIFALDTYYSTAIENVFSLFAKKFQTVKSQFDFPIDIVVAGGTSTPKGFCKKLEEVVKGLSLPFKIKSVKHSTDPRNSVVKGCLTQAIITQKKLLKSSSDEEIKEILGE